MERWKRMTGGTGEKKSGKRKYRMEVHKHVTREEVNKRISGLEYTSKHS